MDYRLEEAKFRYARAFQSGDENRIADALTAKMNLEKDSHAEDADGFAVAEFERSSRDSSAFRQFFGARSRADSSSSSSAASSASPRPPRESIFERLRSRKLRIVYPEKRRARRG